MSYLGREPAETIAVADPDLDVILGHLTLETLLKIEHVGKRWFCKICGKGTLRVRMAVCTASSSSKSSEYLGNY